MHNLDMTPEEAAAIIGRGETLQVEFKDGRRSKLTDAMIVEAATCLANAQGGQLFLGVSDGGAIVGLEPRHGEKTEPHRIDAMILGSTIPPLATSTELVSTQSGDLAVVAVPQATSPIGSSGGKYLRRTLRADGEPQCMPYPLHEMFASGLIAQQTDFASIAAQGATLEDLDPAEFARFRRSCASSGGDAVLAVASDADILYALRVLRPEVYPQPPTLTLGAILMFGTEEAVARFLPNHEVIFHELEGTRIRTSKTLRAPLLRAAEQLQELISIRNTEEEFVSGLLRVAVPRIPHQVVREGVANALLHRDYLALGSVRVQLDDSEFRVSSPGGFPPGVTVDSLLSHSVPRSPILAEAFKRAGIVDRAGRGIREMYTHLLRSGRGVPDYSRSTEHNVELVVDTSDADLDFARFILEYENLQQQSLSLTQLRVLSELKLGGPQSVSEVDAILEMGVVLLRPVFRQLSESGLVEARGSGRNRRYSLTASFYRIAQSSEYVRMQDTDPIQQAQMIIDYVMQFGSITRGKAAELCRLTPQQASALLRNLVDDGRLVMQGTRRAARYVMP